MAKTETVRYMNEYVYLPMKAAHTQRHKSI